MFVEAIAISIEGWIIQFMLGSRDVIKVLVPIALVYERSMILNIGYFRGFDEM